MVFVYVVAGGVLLVAIFHLIAGWVLSNGLRQAALDVGERPEEIGVWVSSVDSKKIVLETDEARQDIGHPGVLGLSFEGGTGRVGEVTHVDGLRVTRELLDLDSDSHLQPGTPVSLEPYVFLTDPSEVGLEFTEDFYSSDVGDFGAWRIPGSDPSLWAIHVHGWTADRRELIRIQPTFHAVGYTSLIIDYRNDPGTPQDPTGMYRFGLTEWRDLEGAVEHAIANGAEEIVLSGCSTGGAIVLSFLENSDLSNHVKAIVLDAPNIVLSEAIRLATADTRATRLMIEFGMWISDLRWKVDWDQTNYVHRIESILDVPALAFHGTSDRRVPIAVSRQLEARRPSHVDLIETPAAGHVMSWNANPERYERYVRSFLDRI